jgi:nucleoside-diphosphate-sugar epimerase
MRVLITGAAGFIGRHLRAELQQHGHDVIGVDRHSADGVHDHDLRQSIRLPLLYHKPDMVVHLAAHVGRLFGEDDMTAAIADNALATPRLAKDCGDLGIRLAYASTSEVYGDRGNDVCWESDNLDVLPHNLYGLSKRWGEEACRLYAHDPIIFRFSMPYGPGVPPGRGRRALDTMLWQAHHRMPITVHRGAERSWCWVGDTVSGVRMVLESGAGGAWNVGRDDAPVSMLALAERCCDLTGAPRDLIRVVDPPDRQTVVKRLATAKLRVLGWAPTVELEDGLPRVLEWVREFDAQGRHVPERQAA